MKKIHKILTKTLRQAFGWQISILFRGCTPESDKFEHLQFLEVCRPVLNSTRKTIQHKCKNYTILLL